MKNMILMASIALVPFALFSTSETAKKPAHHSPYYGPTEISDQTLEQLTIYGPAFIKNTNVSGKATLKGPVNAQNSTFNQLHIDGIAKFEDVKVAQFTINGPLAAINSTLDNVSIASNELSLNNSTVKKLEVKTNSFTFGKQTVYLDKGSKIDHLVFESGKGVVIQEDAVSSVTTLEGGEIKKGE